MLKKDVNKSPEMPIALNKTSALLMILNASVLARAIIRTDLFWRDIDPLMSSDPGFILSRAKVY